MALERDERLVDDSSNTEESSGHQMHAAQVFMRDGSDGLAGVEEKVHCLLPSPEACVPWREDLRRRGIPPLKSASDRNVLK